MDQNPSENGVLTVKNRVTAVRIVKKIRLRRAKTPFLDVLEYCIMF